jgi:hypothetical protein
MSETPKSKRATDKSPYVKPSIKRVHLKPAEAVLAGCKLSTGGSAGPTGPNCKSGNTACIEHTS